MWNEKRKSKVQSSKSKAGTEKICAVIDFDLRPVRRREDDVVPAVARRAAGHDARHHLHDARAAAGEKDGVDYYFLEPAEFQRRVQAGKFIEHATVFGRSYGILRSELLDKLRLGKDVLLNVDVQGAATIRDRALADPELKRALVTVFLTPPSIAILEERLKKRASDAAEEIQKRLGIARKEIAQWKNFDYLLISTTHPGGFAADAGDYRGGKDAFGKSKSAGILSGRALYSVLRQAAFAAIT